MLDLWTALKLSLGEAKTFFLSRNFKQNYSQAKKKLHDEVSKYSSPKLQIDPVLLAQPSSKRPTSFPFLFFLLKNYVCFLFESARIGTSNGNGWKLTRQSVALQLDLLSSPAILLIYVNLKFSKHLVLAYSHGA